MKVNCISSDLSLKKFVFVKCVCFPYYFTFISLLWNLFFSKENQHRIRYAHTIKYTFIPLFRAILPSTPQLLMSVATSLCRPRLAASGGGGGGWLGAGLRAALRSAQCCSGVPRVRCLRHTSLSSFYFEFYLFKVVQELFY